tara:strand:- start:97 stop:246 length:150 start_codon:yes stop_codon:yes gene_type:complete
MKENNKSLYTKAGVLALYEKLYKEDRLKISGSAYKRMMFLRLKHQKKNK